ncbi:MAG: hypothetical protein DRP64_05990 [Verrucomicrobia bacterium]|nr:MAG: hypothetical protein DRP64_05990 [Verrucomicrobiota bacterium]
MGNPRAGHIGPARYGLSGLAGNAPFSHIVDGLLQESRVQWGAAFLRPEGGSGAFYCGVPPSHGTPSFIPEPASLGLFGLIGGRLLWIRKRSMK